MGVWEWFIHKPEKRNRIRIVDPEKLYKSMKDNAYCRGYCNLRKVYRKNELTSEINGRRVKCWKIVKCAYDFADDEFIPIFYSKKI